MNPYLSSSSLKRIAKGQLLGRYSSVIFIFLLHMLCLVSLQMLVSLVLAPTNIIKFILYYAALYLVYIVSGFFKAGEAYVYLKVASNQPVTVNDLFYCFRGESNRTSYIQIRLAAIQLFTTPARSNLQYALFRQHKPVCDRWNLPVTHSSGYGNILICRSAVLTMLLCHA